MTEEDLNQWASEQDIAENHDRLLARDLVFQQYGYDHDKANSLILDRAPGLTRTVLEIGSGKGRFLTSLLRKGHVVTSVDISYDEQRLARLNVAYCRLSKKVNFIQADATRLPLKDGSFASAVSVNALHHFADWRTLLQELLRVVAPLGVLMLADFNEAGLDMLDRIHAAEGRSHPRGSYRLEEVSSALEDYGWQVRLSDTKHQWVLTAIHPKSA